MGAETEATGGAKRLRKATTMMRATSHKNAEKPTGRGIFQYCSVAVERLLLFHLLVSLWLFVQSPILVPLFWKDKYGFILLPASACVVCALRYRKGGMDEVWRELRSVATDISFPIWFVPYTLQTLDDATLTTSEWTQDLLRRLATLSKYLFMYGPFSFGGALLLVAPWALFLQPMLYQSWFPALKWAALVYGTMVFSGIATNTAMHRFFSHASFRTSRAGAFLLGLLGCTGGQFGPIWWASNHRRHHKYCETEQDVHCPALQGFFYSHCGWIMDRDNFAIRPEHVPRIGKDHWPELLLLDVFCLNIQFAFFLGCAKLLQSLDWIPAQSSEPGFLFRQILVGYDQDYVLDLKDVSALFTDSGLILGCSLAHHAESLINSWCHSWELQEGEKKEASVCEGLDYYWVGLLNAGEGFHANHHRFAADAQHGPAWYYDWTYAFICGLEHFGLVWDVVRPSTKRQRPTGQKAAPSH